MKIACMHSGLFFSYDGMSPPPCAVHARCRPDCETDLSRSDCEGASLGGVRRGLTTLSSWNGTMACGRPAGRRRPSAWNTHSASAGRSQRVLRGDLCTLREASRNNLVQVPAVLSCVGRRPQRRPITRQAPSRQCIALASRLLDTLRLQRPLQRSRPAPGNERSGTDTARSAACCRASFKVR